MAGLPSLPHSASLSIAIVGAGAIGCRLAFHLAKNGVACVLFDGWAAHVDAIDRVGLQHVEGHETSTVRLCIHALDAPVSDQFDVVLVAVRSDQTARVAPLAARLRKPSGVLVSCQNGINEHVLAEAVGLDQIFGCTMVYGARLVAPGRVEALQGEDTFRVGAWDAGRASALKLEELVSLFALCGVATRTDNLPGYRWMKLALNAMANPLLLLSGLTASELHSLELARRLMAAIAREVLAAAEVSGARVEPLLGIDAARWVSRHPHDEDAIDQCLSRHGAALGARRLSMVADFQARGQTEVDHINGFVVRALQAAGLPARLNQGVVNLVHDIELGRRAIAPDNLRELALLMPDTIRKSLT